MIDEIYDRNYQAARAAMNRDLDRLFGRIARRTRGLFGAIHRVNFSAPWKQRAAFARHR